MKKRRKATPEQQAILAKYCNSFYEGCMCFFDKGHEGVHYCESCHANWTDADAQESMEKIRKWSKS